MFKRIFDELKLFLLYALFWAAIAFSIKLMTGGHQTNYELRIFRKGTPQYLALVPYAIHFIGHQGKKYGYLTNVEFEEAIGARVGTH